METFARQVSDSDVLLSLLQTVTGATTEGVYGFSGLVDDVSRLPSVREVGLSGSPKLLDLWVLTDHENQDEIDQVYLFELGYLEKPGHLDVFIHVLPLNRVERARLPSFNVLYQR